MKPYTIQYNEPLGKGSSGIVYKGYWNHQPAIPIAVKRLPISKYSLNEINILKSLQNYASPQGPIPQIYHVEKTKNSYELIMEYLSGGCLTQWIEKNHILSEQKILHILYDITYMLYLCHQKQILYGDLKPSNLIATQSLLDPCNINYTLVKTIDYGMSKKHPPKFFTYRFGTPTFMAPEVYNEKFSYPVDIWALGICMYLLITGYYPFILIKNSTNPFLDYQLMVQNQEPTFNEPRWKIYSKDLQQLIRVMLNKNMFERPTSQDILNHPLLISHISLVNDQI
uniref:Protein kinase domain-containing protein n=1 Tax=viral metagenome TaxID=1070528 RepID=A0A6C0CSW1_9ZZZZ